MARPRKNKRDYLPENLYVQVRGGRDYFSYRDPVTKKSVSIGFDCAAAIDYALKANRGIADLIIERGHPSSKPAKEELLEYQSIVDAARDSTKRPGVYFLLQDDDLVYVGKSIDVEYRIGQHRNGGKIPFNRVAVVWCGISELSRLEARYIRKFTPVFNATLPMAQGHDPEESCEHLVTEY